MTAEESHLLHENKRGCLQEEIQLHTSASAGDILAVSTLLTSQIDIHEKDSEGRTALHWAVDRGHVEVVEKLLMAGLIPDLQDLEGQTPLHYAALCEHKEVLCWTELLCQFPSMCDDAWIVALPCLVDIWVFVAAQVAELLIKHGALVNILDENGDTPETIAPKSWNLSGGKG